MATANKFKTNFQIGMIERYNPIFNTVKNIIKNEGKAYCL